MLFVHWRHKKKTTTAKCLPFFVCFVFLVEGKDPIYKTSWKSVFLPPLCDVCDEIELINARTIIISTDSVESSPTEQMSVVVPRLTCERQHGAAACRLQENKKKKSINEKRIKVERQTGKQSFSLDADENEVQRGKLISGHFCFQIPSGHVSNNINNK